VTCRYLKEDTLPPHQLHLESLAGMNSADVDKICRELDKEVRQQVREQRIIKIADGNPRLLRWLLNVFKQPGLESDDLLTRLENTQQEFRENILAQTLLSGLEDGEKKFLARLSVFHLPVTEDVVRAATSPPAPLLSATPPPAPLLTKERGARDEQRLWLEKLVSLSLVESATTHATQTAEYRVTTILELLLEPILSEEEWLTTRQQAARKIYQVWWEESEEHREEKGLEVVRLALLAEEKEISVVVGDVIANNWVNSSRYLEAWELCQQILQLREDYRTLGTIARAEAVLGFMGEAQVHYQKALELCPKDDLKEKSTTLANMARIITQLGDIQQALSLYQQSLEISERIDYAHGKAGTLQAMAGIFAQLGEIQQALSLYQQSLEIYERIDYAHGKAATLHNMAILIAQLGDIEQALSLYQQSLEIKRRIGDANGEAATLYAMAIMITQLGDIEQALSLYQQSLKINERIGNQHGKAATLHAMATMLTQFGDIEQALSLYQQSLEIRELIGDVLGKATTLNNMAYLAGETGDKARELELLLQAAQILAKIRAYVDLLTSLSNLGFRDESKQMVYLAQAIWLTLRIQAPLANTIAIIRAFHNAVPQGDELKALLGTTALFFCRRRGEGHPQLEKLQKLSVRMISAAAGAQGIETQEAFETWFVQQRLNDPEYYLPRLTQRLEEIVGDGWLFDRSQVS
jgi:tetratricopeptide (TPR) repeat protein